MSVSVIVTQLATLESWNRGNLGEARRNYLEALVVDQRISNPGPEASNWHQLGMVAEEDRDWDEAERCYKRLAIKGGCTTWRAARTSNQLAIVAAERRQIGRGRALVLAGRLS
ncbi:MAG: tetratricopeptide repeat protein [Anaerolineae bacterium]|nr:tetratricopeptide repeat protein [Anaerolineae bacterium]